MKKILLISAAAFWIGITTLPVSAQTTSNSNSSQSRPVQINRNQAKQAIEQRRNERAQAMREKRQEATEKFKEKRLEFKNRLEAIQDAKKRQTLQRLDQKMAQMNNTHTTRMNNILESFDQLLSRFIEKTKELEQQGIDVSSVDNAISQAQVALASAQSAVEEQAGKDYVTTIKGDESLRQDFGTTVAQFKTDLTQVRSLIIDAKRAISVVAKELARVRSQGKAQNVSTNSAQ